MQYQNQSDLFTKLLQEYTKMVTTTTGDPASSDALAAGSSGIHFIEKVRSPETTTGFLGLKNERRLNYEMKFFSFDFKIKLVYFKSLEFMSN